MNRFEEMDNFLKKHARIYQLNPNIEIFSDTIYNNLSCYGLTNQDFSNINIGDNFDKWIDYFKDKKLNVYFTPKQKGFLQFNNMKPSDKDFVKIYMSFPSDQILECVKIIFDFIEKNNMPTYSKVANCIRTDAVVLRMETESDARKLLKFVNTNPILSKYLNKPNPFLFQEENMALSCDFYLSYNGVISLILKNYFQACRNSNTLGNVNLEHFKQFVTNEYQEIFQSNNALGINKFFRDYEVIKYRSRLKNDAECFINYYQIFTLFLKSLNNNFSLEDYFSHFNWCNNIEIKNDLNNIFTGRLNDYFSNNQNLESISSESYRSNLLYNASLATIKKYGIKHLYHALDYAKNGNFQAFTNDGTNLYRQKLKNLIEPNELENLIREILIKYYKYNSQSDIELVFCELLKETLEKKNKYINQEKIYTLINASVATLKKYGINQLHYALNYARKGNFQAFTNDGINLYREKLINLVKPEELELIIQEILTSNGIFYVNDSDIYTLFCQFLYNRIQNTNKKYNESNQIKK